MMKIILVKVKIAPTNNTWKSLKVSEVKTIFWQYMYSIKHVIKVNAHVETRSFESTKYLMFTFSYN